MSYPALLTVATFSRYTVTSVNVAESLMAPYVRDAWKYDLAPLLGSVEEGALALDRANWSPELETLFAEHIEPFWVLSAYARFLSMHGIHITAAGVEVLSSDVNRVPVSRAERAELKADAEGKASIERGRLDAALRAYRGPAQPTTCSSTRRRPNRGGLQFHAV